jgi:glycosyl transferase family 2
MPSAQETRRPPYHPNVRDLPASRHPRVSVIIPCFNYGHFLTECVDSVLQQTAVDLDVLIVNDASSDNSAELAHELADRDSRVSVIDHERNCGLFPSINEALEKVRGEYIVKLDADDMLTPGSIARSTALLEAHPTVGFVYGRALYFGEDLKKMLSWSHRWLRRSTLSATNHPPTKKIDTRVRGWTVWPGETWLALRCARGVNCISQPEVVIRASAIRDVGSYDVDLPITSDLAMWLRLAGTADVAHIDGAIQGLYRVHARSMQRTELAGGLKELRVRLATFDSALAQRSNSIPNAHDLLMTAHRSIAAEALDNVCRAFDRGKTLTEPVDDYIAFALESYPEAPSLPEWRRLLRRRRVGATWSRYCPPFVLRAVLRRAAEELAAVRWWRSGV